MTPKRTPSSGAPDAFTPSEPVQTPDAGQNPGPLLTEADLTLDAQGHPVSARYGDVYASRAGAAGQAREVFLRGCGLLDQPAQWADRAQFAVLETGFGLGINFLATWAAWRADPQRSARLHYVALELHPVRAADLLAHAPAEFHGLAAELAAQWPPALRGLHSVVLDDGRVRLLLAFGDANALAPRLQLAADAFYLDGFAPARNPASWQPDLFRALARLARPGARLATYTVARAVRDGLERAGFQVGLRPGWGGKRQRLEAVFAPRWSRSRRAPPAPWPADRPRRAVVIGAGIAGAACARALALRGWAVDVLEAGPHPAGGGSSMPAGLAHVQLSADDNILSRLTRAGMAALRRAVPANRPDLARFTGVLVAPVDDEDAQRMAEWRDGLRLPQQTARWLDAPAARQTLGVDGAGEGWLVDGAVLANAPLCLAWLGSSAEIRLRCAAAAARLERDGDDWTVRNADGALLARAPQVVLACAGQTPQLLAASGLLSSPDWMPLRTLRGQAQALPATRWPALKRLCAGWTGSGYALPLPAAAAQQLRRMTASSEVDWLLVGATYETTDAPLSAEQAWARNCLGIAALAPAPPQRNRTPERRDFVGDRAVSPDRLPYCGPLPDLGPVGVNPAERARWAGKHLHELPRHPGLHVCAGMGSRGLTLAALLAECAAAQIEGEPLPIETDLAASLDPARIALRRLRRGTV